MIAPAKLKYGNKTISANNSLLRSLVFKILTGNAVPSGNLKKFTRLSLL